MTTMLDPSLYVSAAYRKPFGLDGSPTMMKFSPDLTIAQMVASFMQLPPDFHVRGDVLIGEHIVPREHWHRVRLKPGQSASFFYAPGDRGGGGSGGKRGKSTGLFALIIGIATILTAGAALTGAFASGGFFLAGSTGAKVLAGVITVAGQLLAKAITKPPTQKNESNSSDEDSKAAASASGNLLEAGAPIGTLLGTMKVFPMLLTQPYTYRINGDEWVEAVFGYAGPIQWNDIKVGGTAIAAAADVTYQTREGWDYDTPIDLVQRYAVTAQPGIELSVHDVVGDDQQQLRNQVLIDSNLPIFHPVGAANTPDQINVDFSFPEGLYDTTDPDTYLRVPIRMRMRNQDTGAIYNLPELHYKSKTAREIRASIILVWGAPPDSTPAVPTAGFSSVFYSVPAQASPPMGGWTADASFFGSGDTYLNSTNQSTTGIVRVGATGTDETTFYLNAAAIPKGRYQIETQRGEVMKNTAWSDANYQLSGTVIDPFGYIFISGMASITQKRVNFADRLGLVRVSSVFNSHPIFGGQQGSGLALIAVKAKNRSIENLSAVAKKYVKTWDGTGWNVWATSSNPADHYYEVLRGTLTPDPIDLVAIDNDSLVTWRDVCTAKGYTCNMICEGDALQDILEIIASCGYARPRMSETWGVIMDYDRSAESPTQIFTAANSYGMTMENEFVRLPDALRIVYTDSAADYASNEDIVYREGVPATADARLEQMTYRGIVTLADARKRAEFDLAQVQLRAGKFTFSAGAETLRSTRGDLIAINHDFIDVFHDSGRIVDVEINDGDVTAVVMDRKVAVYNEPDMLTLTDMFAVEDMLTVGAHTSVSIRQSTTLISTHAVVGSGNLDRLELVTPYPLIYDDDDRPAIRPDNLAWVGASGHEYRRLIMTSVSYDKNMMANIEAVAEAPELWAA